jgi:putative spermidine/putrescine transport system ATP-binding protein
MSEGTIEQLATPLEVYHRPRTGFVAQFIGGANVLRGRQRIENNGVFDTEFGIELPVPLGVSARIEAVAVRPEDIEIVADGAAGATNALVKRARFLGSVVEYTLETDTGHQLTARADGHFNLPENSRIYFAVRPDRIVPLERP